ncbi:MAG: PAAR domain-containing protein [Polyangiaceae bacterium]|nr:PAAR domain-containing protein [Polyangiaceae bacterium]
MAEAACRVGDHGLSPTSRGIATNGSPNVDINGKAALRVCDKGVGETGPCTGNRWEPIMGSSTVEVNGKPLVRVTDMTQHFACGMGVMIDGSPNVVAGGAGQLPNQSTLDAVIKYIYDEMMRNKDDPRTARIRMNNEMFKASMQPNPFGPSFPDWGSFYRAMDQWKDMVGYGKPWDHKSYISQNFGEYSYDAGTNTSLPFDTWSNIHYGFVGEAAGFDGKTLLDGAGLAQWLNDNPGASALDKAGKYAEFLGGNTAQYDHPEDQEAIKIGSELWKKYKETGSLTEQDVKDAVMRNKSLLGAIAGQVC